MPLNGRLRRVIECLLTGTPPGYGEKNASRCAEFPSLMVIEDVHFKNFFGTTSKRYDPTVGQLVCSGPGVCFPPLSPFLRPEY